MTKHLTKRTFLFHAFVVVGGAVLLGGHALAQSSRFKLKMIDQQSASRPGLKRRLQRLRISSIKDAFDLANTKSEIEVTL